MRLGLALSGGGFRATLFHLGVLTRLAELDLLRHLHMISSVSGGSILAAHYMLLLKPELEASPDGRLPKKTYERIVVRLRTELEAALRRDPRNRLLGDVRAIWKREGLSQRMARNYQRFLFGSGTKALNLPDPLALAQGPRLSDMRFRIDALRRASDITRYNEERQTDCIPQLVLNAATLNTASRFTFTFTEVGDEVLGYVRFDELDLLARYRRVLATWDPGGDAGLPARAVLASADHEAEQARAMPEAFRAENEPFRRRRFLADHLAWLDATTRDGERLGTDPGREFSALSGSPQSRTNEMLSLTGDQGSRAVKRLLANPNWGARFLDVPFIVLRQAKLSAWYLLHDELWRSGDDSLRQGGYTYAEHRARFRAAIRDVDQHLAAQAIPEPLADLPPPEERDWHEFALEIYYLRLCRDVPAHGPVEIRLPIAVQASANFPPVFAALHPGGIFDEQRVRKLQLSDGGLNDNNGIEALFEGRCTHIIASEAGPRPAIKPRVTGNRFGLVGQIMINQLPIVRRLLMRTLREQERVSEALGSLDSRSSCLTEPIRELRKRYPIEGVAFFDMDTSLSAGADPDQDPKPLRPHPLARKISLLRTDLDAFNVMEQHALLYQGYQYCDRFVRRYLYGPLQARLQLEVQPPPVRDHWPLHEWGTDWNHSRRVLEAGASLFGRARRIAGRGHRTWWTVTLLGGGAALGLGIVLELVRLSWLSRIEGCHAVLWVIAVGLSAALGVAIWLGFAYWIVVAWLGIDAALAARAVVPPNDAAREG